jgi:hypothetical protein
MPRKSPPKPEVAPQPWDRQPGESTLAYHYFQIFLNLGPSRSIAEVCRIKRPPKPSPDQPQADLRDGQVKQWAMKYRWTDRALAWEDAQHREAMDAARRYLAKQIERDFVKTYALADQAMDKAREVLEAALYPQCRETVEIRDGAPTIIHQHYEPGRWSLRDAATLLKVANELKQAVSQGLDSQAARGAGRPDLDAPLPADVAERLERFERSMLERLDNRPQPPPGLDGATSQSGTGFALGVRYTGPPKPIGHD